MLRSALHFLLQLGFLGPLVMGIADSSFLFLPIGNDLLIIILGARHHDQFWIYSLLGALGSALGVLLLDMVARKIGETGVQKMIGPRQFNYLKRRIATRGGFFVAFASLAPPPFPFTMTVAATSALGYSRRNLLLIVFATRLIRFLILSALAIRYGRQILRWINTDVFRYSAIGLAIVCVAVSALSIARWMQSARGRGR